MKNILHLVSCMVLLLGTLPIQSQTQAVPAFPNVQNDSLFDQATYQRLRDTMIDIGWKNADLKTVLRDLTLSTKRENPLGDQINFRFESSTNPTDRQRTINVPSGRAPVFTVLQNLGQQASFGIKVHKNLVLIVPWPAK